MIMNHRKRSVSHHLPSIHSSIHSSAGGSNFFVNQLCKHRNKLPPTEEPKKLYTILWEPTQSENVREPSCVRLAIRKCTQAFPPKWLAQGANAKSRPPKSPRSAISSKQNEKRGN